jgi:hypothetical protein
MKILLGPLLLATLLLGGCGSDSSDVATDQPSQSTAPPTPSDSATKGGSPTESQTIALLHQTAAGGHVDPNAVRLDDETAQAQFAGQFQRGLDKKIAKAIASATIPSGQVLVGAVVSIGCDVPPGVTVTLGPDGYVLVPEAVPSPLKECFAPVTTVALVAVPA